MKVKVASFSTLLFRLLALGSFLLLGNLYPDVKAITIFMSVYLIVELFFVSRLNYISPNFGFNASWLLIILFSMFDFSSFYRPIYIETITIVSTAILIFNIFSTLTLNITSEDKTNVRFSNSNLRLLKLVFILFIFLNIGIAGYIPLVKLFTFGDSGYLEFGVPGLYGIFLAFSNALGVLLFYLYLKTNNNKHLYFYLFIFLIFILFMTRQNIISLVVESFFVYTALKGRVQILKASIIFLITIFVFGLLGTLRSGDISDLAGVHPEYSWVPTAFIWIYSYFYFNVLNFDNLVNYSNAPYYDLSSLSSFLPSFLRGGTESIQDYASTLEMANFNIASYMYPLYADMGQYWLYVFTAIVALVTKIYFDKLSKEKSFILMASCAVLYFCALMSFFVNFWAYLPIIFQLVFIPLLWRFVRR